MHGAQPTRGTFGEADTYLVQLQGAHPSRQSHLGKLLRYEAELIRQKDSEEHDISEAD
jgi:hypothetical protein